MPWSTKKSFRIKNLCVVHLMSNWVLSSYLCIQSQDIVTVLNFLCNWLFRFSFQFQWSSLCAIFLSFYFLWNTVQAGAGNTTAAKYPWKYFWNDLSNFFSVTFFSRVLNFSLTAVTSGCCIYLRGVACILHSGNLLTFYFK